MPEEAGKTYGISERGGRYAPIRKDPEIDAIQIHTTEKCLRVRKQNIIMGGQTEIQIDRIDTVAKTIKEVSGYEKLVVLLVNFRTEQKAHQSQYPETYKSPQDFLPSNMTLPTTSSSF